MEILFLPVAGLLEDIANSMRVAVQDGDGFLQVGILLMLLAGLGILLSAARQVFRLITRTDSRDREEKRVAIRECANATALLKDTEKRVDDLRCYDPDVFLKEVATAKREGTLSKLRSLPEAWLEPLRPALARAYGDLARETLHRAGDEVALSEAHRLTYAALAADSDLKELDTLFAAIEDARQFLRSDTLSDEQAEAWRLAREMQDPVSLFELGKTLIERGHYHLALTALERSATLLRQKEGPKGRNALTARGEYARCLGLLGRHADALKKLTEVWEVWREPGVLGPRHPDTLASRGNMASEMGSLGRHTEALEIFTEVWEVARAPDVLGPRHPHTLNSRANMASQMGSLGRHAEALEIFTEIWEVQRQPDVLGPRHPDTLTILAYMAFHMGSDGELDKAIVMFEETWAIERSDDVLGEGHPTHLRRRYSLARLNDLAGQADRADALLSGLRADMLARFDETHEWIRDLDSYLAQRDAPGRASGDTSD